MQTHYLETPYQLQTLVIEEAGTSPFKGSLQSWRECGNHEQRKRIRHDYIAVTFPNICFNIILVTTWLSSAMLIICPANLAYGLREFLIGVKKGRIWDSAVKLLLAIWGQ